jgi:hypothetical protein
MPDSYINKKDVPLSKFPKNVSSIGSGINYKIESDLIYKIEQNVSALKIQKK